MMHACILNSIVNLEAPVCKITSNASLHSRVSRPLTYVSTYQHAALLCRRCTRGWKNAIPA